MKRRGLLKISAAALCAFFLLGTVFFAYYAWHKTSEEVDGHVTFKTTYTPSDFGIEAEKISLTTEDGLTLAAWRVDAENPRAVVVFASGFHAPSVSMFFGHAKMLRDAGYSSILVELRGRGESEGDTLGVGTTEYMDIRAAVFYAKDLSPALPVVAFGFSMGGTAAINAIGETDEIDAVIAVSAASSWPDMLTDNMRQGGIPEIACLAEKPFVWLAMGLRYGFNKLHINPVDEIKKLNGRPALLMHSRDDRIVPFESFLRLTQAAPEAETYVIEGNRHRVCQDDCFLDPQEDADYAGAILAFLNEHFGS